MAYHVTMGVVLTDIRAKLVDLDEALQVAYGGTQYMPDSVNGRLNELYTIVDAAKVMVSVGAVDV